MTMLLENKIALVTGASSGIGRATSLLFSREGAAVSLVGRDRDALESVLSEIEAGGGQGLVAPADVTCEADCRRVVDQTVDRYSGLDVLVNAAGIIGTGTLESTSRREWQEMMAINVDAVFVLMQLALPHLKQRVGNIVNVSSVTGLRAFPGVLSYCVSKAAADQLTRCAALELAECGVRVNAVNPGVVQTNLHRRGGMDPEAYAAFLEHSRTTHPLGRVGQPDEVADAILFLSSPKAGWLTGLTLSIDGGRQLTCAR
jgi:NAD(P)-dependent dehydrogenase (short-subunit alcohol dehydrogenase family)